MAAQQFFVDWTFRNDEKTRAVGTLGGHRVTLTGEGAAATPAVSPLGAAYLHQDWQQFELAQFSPPLRASDMIEIVGLAGHSFNVVFETDVQAIVLHLGSLASTLVFTNLPAGTTVTKLSGDDDFKVVDGNKVVGKYVPFSGGVSDSNGSVQLKGLQPFSSIAFTLEPLPTVSGHDGVHLQIGGTVEPLQFVDWTSRNDEKTRAVGTLDGQRVTLTGEGAAATPAVNPLGAAYLHQDWQQFGLDSFTPQLPYSDMIEIVGLVGHSFKVKFEADMKNLVFHLGSLASTLEFTNLPAGTTVTELSGDDDFEVVGGNKVEGQYHPFSGGVSDSNGTVRLSGSRPFRSIAFTLKPNPPVSGHDGVHLQIGGAPIV
ncbi:hypothetical protein OG250_24685 [Streptomyces sp. NBC_00487]|uniref:hypothetical protein n=1 Tax=unclassified Streptomyces TaxID=2593676 RepID=UPI002E175411|nr:MULTISPECIES: hypothetical protein [unclassified Streptomyces]